ncbi:hypothetical protein HDA40_006945 [Hamadaea flava]|nr:hypothetical protein [Hamadaea flava]
MSVVYSALRELIYGAHWPMWSLVLNVWAVFDVPWLIYPFDPPI